MSRDITAAPPVPADQRHSYGVDASQFFDLFLPHAMAPASAAAFASGFAVMIHGGFWRAKYDLAHTSHLCAALAAAGYPCINLEYRRAGSGPGGGGGWPTTFNDLQTGLAAARKLFAAAPVVIGHSAGGHLALRLAAPLAGNTADIRAVLALAPVADLQLAYDLHLSHDAVVEFLGGTPAERPDIYAAADAARHPSRLHRTLIHGTQDAVVPIALSHSYCEKMRAADSAEVELIELADAGHFDLIDPQSKAWPRVLECVRILMAGAAGTR